MNDDEFAIKAARVQTASADRFSIITAKGLLVTAGDDDGSVGDRIERSAKGVFEFFAMMYVKVVEPCCAVEISGVRCGHLRRLRHRPAHKKMLDDRARGARRRSRHCRGARCS